METNLKKLKNHLSVIFALIVFVVILSLGNIFFSAKYIKEISMEKNMLTKMISLLNTWEISFDSIMEMWPKYNEVMIWKRKGWIPPMREFSSRGFINYIYLNNEKLLISSNIKDPIEEELILSIIENDDFFEIKQKEGFFIKKFHTEKGTFIILKKLPYSFSDYLGDILGFFFISLLFSLLFYFIGEKFVWKTLIPVEENIKDMKHFIHNAEHELKTPIAVIDSNLQLMKEMKNYDSLMITEMRKEVKKLNSLIETLIQLSDIDALKQKEKINLKEIIEEIINEKKKIIKDKKLNTEIKIKKDIFIEAKKDYLFILLSNIIGNAIKYSKEKWNIYISFTSSELHIKDEGIGIKKEHLEKIFDRFFKGDSVRNSEGYGIGLSLVKKIADIYKWKIKVISEENKWTDFCIIFKWVL